MPTESMPKTKHWAFGIHTASRAVHTHILRRSIGYFRQGKGEKKVLFEKIANGVQEKFKATKKGRRKTFPSSSSSEEKQ